MDWVDGSLNMMLAFPEACGVKPTSLKNAPQRVTLYSTAPPQTGIPVQHRGQKDLTQSCMIRTFVAETATRTGDTLNPGIREAISRGEIKARLGRTSSAIYVTKCAVYWSRELAVELCRATLISPSPLEMVHCARRTCATWYAWENCLIPSNH